LALLRGVRVDDETDFLFLFGFGSGSGEADSLSDFTLLSSVYCLGVSESDVSLVGG
jgi:hypothetical protein